MNRAIDTSRRPRLGVLVLAAVLPALGCASFPSRANDPFDTHGLPFTGATTAAEVDAAHHLGAGTLSIVLVPCGASRFVGFDGASGLGGYYGSSRTVHRIDVRARVEPDAGTLHVRVTAPDGVAAHDQWIPVTATDTEGQRFDVRVDAGRVAPTGTWIVELRAEGACRAMRLALSMHTAPISGP